jgi:hypothetical protein
MFVCMYACGLGLLLLNRCGTASTLAIDDVECLGISRAIEEPTQRYGTDKYLKLGNPRSF